MIEWVIDCVSDSVIDPEPWFVTLSRREKRFSVNSTVFGGFNESVTDRPTDRPTDTPSYSDAWTHLKSDTSLYHCKLDWRFQWPSFHNGIYHSTCSQELDFRIYPNNRGPEFVLGNHSGKSWALRGMHKGVRKRFYESHSFFWMSPLVGIGCICFKYFLLTPDVPILVDDHLRHTQMSFCNLLNPKKSFFCVF